MRQKTSQFDETERLSSLYRLRLLDTKPEQEFDELVKLAAELFDVPISFITLVDKDRLWIKAKYGASISEIGRQDAFCDFAIRQPELFVVQDTLEDSRFCDTALVQGEANIRCYVGIPLLSDDGYAVGVLSVLDHQPRIFTEKQLSFLVVIGKQVEALLKLRLRNIELEETNQRLEANEKQLKESEQELKKSETRLNLVLAGVNDGWWDWNLEDSYLFYSLNWWSMLGYQPDEFVVTPELWHELLHPDDVSRVDTFMETQFNTGIVTYEVEFRLLHKEGHYVPVLSKGHILRNDAGNATRISGSNMDLTAIKKVEQEQKSILAAIPDLLFRFDSEDRYMYCHASKKDELFMPIEDFLGKKIEEIVPAPAVHILKDTMVLARLSGNVEVVEYSFDIPNLGMTWFEARIMKSSEEEIVAIVRNITERKTAEKALQKSEANLNTVFKNTDVGYYLFDENLNIVAFNEPAQRFTTAEFHKPLEVGNQFYDYFPEATKLRLAGVMKEIFKGNKIAYETSFEKPNEEASWYYTMYSPVSNNEDKVVGVVMSTENITLRKQNEIALTKSLELLSNQNKRLLNFSYIVSHNLRSHTSNIKSILNLLPYASSEEERNKMIQLLEVASSLLNETIHNLNEVVSIQNNNNLLIEPINLRESIEKTLLVLDEPITHKKAQIQIEVDNTLTINYNPAYLESILLNFLSNAIKYSHPDRSPIVSLKCTQQENQLLMVITDNGIGIDMEKHGDDLFGMYKTFNGNTDARGVGLFITKNQIEAMGGRVEVTSELGEGTTFRIFIK